MPAVQAPAKVLVTGASGFLAIHVVQAYLRDGFSVRGTVRSQAKGEYLVQLLKNPNFEYVVVPDIQSDSAFDDAVKGVQAIAHTASPVAGIVAGDPEVVAIRPAVLGTLNILESAKRFGTEVKRVVITSSNVAVAQPLLEKHYDETGYNDDIVQFVKQNGEEAGPSAAYCAGKTLAEKAAWEWQAKNKDVKFDVTTLCPPWIWGPTHQQLKDRSELKGSLNYLMTGIESEKTGDELTDFAGFYIDVRDISTLHVLATSTEGAGNLRLLTAARGWTWQDIYDSLQENPPVPNTPVGEKPGATRGKKWDASYGQERLAKVLGKSIDELFRPFSETFRDAVLSVREN